MKKILIIAALALLVFAGCNDNKPAENYCVVKGTIKGVKEGKTLELSDEFNDYVVLAMRSSVAVNFAAWASSDRDCGL